MLNTILLLMHHISKLFAQFCNLLIISCLDYFSAYATASSANRLMSLKCSLKTNTKMPEPVGYKDLVEPVLEYTNQVRAPHTVKYIEAAKTSIFFKI